MSERLSDLRLNERELTALENSSGDDCDMASVRCAVAELRAARVVVEAAKAWRATTGHEASDHMLLNQRDARRALLDAIDALAGAK